MTGLEVYLDAETISRRVKELAAEISRDYEGKNTVLIGILKGAALFLADLSRALTIPVEIDLLHASSYGTGTASSGTVRITRDSGCDVAGRHIILVDCIIDSGRTIETLVRHFRERGPASIEAVVLLDKKERRTCDAAVRYVGFTVPDRFLVGYGLDQGGKHRNLPYVATVKPS